jgi:hypothetical protein
MWRNACQPVMQPTDIQSGRDHDVLKMGTRLSNISRAAQAHSAGSLGMDPFYTCPLSIQLSKLLGLLSRARRLSRNVRLTPPHREGPLS